MTPKPPSHPLFDFIQKTSTPIIIFLLTLFILLLIGRPAIYLNDESITTNQLHQLSEGHQFLISEGKYGQYANGTPSEYYAYKNNVLGYSIFLPLLSLPALWFFSLFGDNFRLPILFFWCSIPLLISMILSTGREDCTKMFRVPIIYWGAALSILLMMINLYYYHPFPFTAADAPYEIAAIVLTNSILGSLLSVVIYQISHLVWKKENLSVICTMAIMCCSSYLFWPATGKDHMLMTLCFSLVIYFLIRWIILNTNHNLYLGFFFIGLLAWVRPEVGFSIFAGCLFFLGINNLLIHPGRCTGFETIIQAGLSVVCTAVGAIPLFINNLITTGNPLIPTFYYYFSKTAPSHTEIISAGVSTLQSSETMTQFPSLLPTYYLATSPFVYLKSVLEIFFSPVSGNMSILAVTPLLGTGLVIGIIAYLSGRSIFTPIERQIITLLTISIIFLFAAYAASITSISSSIGITPDMRYFLPIYFLGGLIGFYFFASLKPGMFEAISLSRQILFVGIGALVLTLIIVLAMPGASYPEYTTVFKALIVIICALMIGSLIANLRGYCSPVIVFLIFLIMIAIPLSWQFLMDIFYSVGKVNGYPFWMPYPEYLIEKYLVYTFGS